MSEPQPRWRSFCETEARSARFEPARDPLENSGVRLVMRIQCSFRIFEEHAVFKWIPTPVVEGVKEWARRAKLIQGLYLGALGERLDGR